MNETRNTSEASWKAPRLRQLGRAASSEAGNAGFTEGSKDTNPTGFGTAS